jgi:hypothetical protein
MHQSGVAVTLELALEAPDLADGEAQQLLPPEPRPDLRDRCIR